MGLDQTAYAKTETGKSEELASWRKHPNLQGFMEELFYAKGGEGEFNCEPVDLTLEDINRLEAAIMEGGLPKTTGFFFGKDSDDYYTEQDLEFVDNARQALAEGKAVIYDSWW